MWETDVPVERSQVRPFVTISVFVIVIAMIIGLGSYVSSQREPEPDRGFAVVKELFSPLP